MKKTFQTLYYKARTGKLHQWTVWAEDGFVYTEYGTVGGKLQRSVKASEPKNVGKKNATTEEQQAKSEAQSLWTNKVERRYSLTPEGAEVELSLPMLAKSFDDVVKSKKFRFPVMVQPKLNGLRATASWGESEPKLFSRNGKEYKWPVKIKEQLKSILGLTSTFDGELYKHGVSLQVLNSWVRKSRPESEKIDYYIYDFPQNEGIESTWDIRNLWLMKLKETIDPSLNIVIVEAEMANSEEEVKALEKKYVAMGYEGAIVRTLDGEYGWGRRSPSLLKFKTFKDAEFKIVDAKEGVGKFVGCVIWRCMTKEDKVFDVVPKGTFEDKKEWYTNRESYFGKMLTVKYFDLTDDGIPSFPVGMHIRLDEDLPEED